MKNNKYGFTLVELIVVIIILAILWTIAFFALQWYSQSSRDSVRVSDISRMKTSLEIFNVEAWKYPEPTWYTNVTYSWWIVWLQGTFWDSVVKNVVKLNKIPLDPITDWQYTYSITTNKKEFQIWWIFESDDIWLRNTNEVFAWDVIARVYVVWNYNWKVIKSMTWTVCDILSVPSIIASDVQTSNELVDILSWKKLVYEWYNNLPETFKNSRFKSDGWFDFEPKKLLLYHDTWSCLWLVTNQAYRNALINNYIDSYSWTLLKNISDTNNLYWCSEADKQNYLSNTIIKNTLWIEIWYVKLSWNCQVVTTNTWTTNTWSQDTTAPIILSSGPSGTFSSSWMTLTLTTDENATCKYDTNNVAYASMSNTYLTTWTMNHSSTYTAASGLNTLYARCSDTAWNISNPATITFTYTYVPWVTITMYPASWWTYTCDLCN